MESKFVGEITHKIRAALGFNPETNGDEEVKKTLGEIETLLKMGPTQSGRVRLISWTLEPEGMHSASQPSSKMVKLYLAARKILGKGNFEDDGKIIRTETNVPGVFFETNLIPHPDIDGRIQKSSFLVREPVEI